MVKPVITKRARKRQAEKQVTQHLQALANTMLWNLINGVGGEITITKEELSNIPQGANVRTFFDKETESFTFKSVVPDLIKVPEKKLILRR